MKKLSLRIRLLLSLLWIASFVWLSSAVLSWFESRDYLDEFFDTYQLLLARQLSTADWDNVHSDDQKKINKIINNLDEEGEHEDEALGFAVFDASGKMIFNDNENGRAFPYSPNISGFIDQPIGHKNEMWRIVWMKTADGKFSLAVGQEIAYRNEAALDMVAQNLIPWLIGLSILMLLCFWRVTWEFRSLKYMTRDISLRSPDELSPIINDKMPKEIEPLINAMNQLFERIREMISRERSFISDSSHELRSPLAALRVQLDVVNLYIDDKKMRNEALKKLSIGIERTVNVVEQLLTLSRLEALPQEAEDVELNWEKLINYAVDEQKDAVVDKNIEIIVESDGSYPISKGQEVLWSILLRNLVDNALRYSPNGTWVKIETKNSALMVTNCAANFDEKYIPHLTKRFFRPPGQVELGSGLGIPIIERIASIHNCSVNFENQGEIFVVTVKGK